ncbi:hypothetical protein JHL18_11775 [Clostridium sp. YIM B02505]|uniref:PEP-utilising enzyme mobile domain-containing protein n=1 Tax=Clostridium yunnanense TaxID=2800325 RepID=A0ABS1EPK3_9CLOT|nr:PEP-utilizing enzyme [Clostridium yunnanense]MBK1811305.1 hypothetical protein [Clostridium yunnanense]
MQYCYSSKSKVISMEAMFFAYKPTKKCEIYEWKPHACFIEKKRERWDVYYDKESIYLQQKLCWDIFENNEQNNQLCVKMQDIIENADNIAKRLSCYGTSYNSALAVEYITTLSDLLNYYSFTNEFLFIQIENRVTEELSEYFDERLVKAILFSDTDLSSTYSYQANYELDNLREKWFEDGILQEEDIYVFVQKYAFLLNQQHGSDLESYVYDIITKSNKKDGYIPKYSKTCIPEFQFLNNPELKFKVESIQKMRLLRLKMREAMMRMNYHFTIILKAALEVKYSNFLSEFELNKLVEVLPVETLCDLDHLDIEKLLENQVNSMMCLSGRIYKISRSENGSVQDVFYQRKELGKAQGNVVYGTGTIRGKIVTCYFDNRSMVEENLIYVTKSLHPKDLLIPNKFKAVLVDEGGILSHASIIAREMKIPCITNTGFLSLELNEGDYVEIDFSTGSVRRMDEMEQSSSVMNEMLVKMSEDVKDKELYGNKCINLCSYMKDFCIADGFVLNWRYVQYLYNQWKKYGQVSIHPADQDILNSLSPMILRSSSSYEDNDRFTGAGLLESIKDISGIDDFMEALANVYESSKTKALENYNKIMTGIKAGNVSILIQKYIHFKILGTILLEKDRVLLEYQDDTQTTNAQPNILTLFYKNIDDLNLHAEGEQVLTILIPEIVKLLERDIDVLVEFGIYDEKMYLLQVRKMGAI